MRGGGARGGGLVQASQTYGALLGQLRDAKSQLAALRVRQKHLSEMAGEAHQQVESFSDIEGEASALLAEVTVNERLLSDLQQTEASLEDALSHPPSGLVVLDPGAVPEYPVKNRLKIVVFGAIVVLAAIVALLLVLWGEFRGWLVGTPSEVAFWGNGPALGASSWPDDAHGLDELVAGLDDVAPDTRGSVLLVGSSPRDAHHVRDLALRMNQDWYADYPPTPETVGPNVQPMTRGPLQTPPPADVDRPSHPPGPYPITAGGTRSTALVRMPAPPPREPVRLVRRQGLAELAAWEGPHEGQALRRAARLADRVIVVVRSGQVSALQLNGTHHRLGRKDGVGYLVVGLPEKYHSLPDRVGDVAAFWLV